MIIIIYLIKHIVGDICNKIKDFDLTKPLNQVASLSGFRIAAAINYSRIRTNCENILKKTNVS